MGDEFYVGYEPQAPGGLARFVRARVALLLGAAAAVALAVTLSQAPFSRAVFEYGTTRPFAGWVEIDPYPTLVVPRPGSSSSSRYLLTVFGKHGAEGAVQGFEGEYVRLEGTLIHRDGATMVEVADGSVEAADPGARPGPSFPADGGEVVTLEGEVVDSKCFLGVMKPGNLKPHRACATRCISGGVPPVFLVRDARGHATYYLLTSADGGAVGRQLVDRALVAEPLRVTGRVRAVGDQLVLSADPDAFERLDGAR